MITFEPFEPQHLYRVNVQSEQAVELEELIRSGAAEQLIGSFSLSALLPSGACAACGGLVNLWPGRFQAWVFMSSDAGEHLLAISRQVKYLLDTHPARRIEATVRARFNRGQRFARLVGLRRESGVLRAFYPDGTDAILFARVIDDDRV